MRIKPDEECGNVHIVASSQDCAGYISRGIISPTVLIGAAFWYRLDTPVLFVPLVLVAVLALFLNSYALFRKYVYSMTIQLDGTMTYTTCILRSVHEAKVQGFKVSVNKGLRPCYSIVIDCSHKSIIVPADDREGQSLKLLLDLLTTLEVKT